MKQGIYEQLISKLVKSNLNQLDKDLFFTQLTALDLEESSIVLSQYIQKVVKEALETISANKSELLEKRISLINQIVQNIKTNLNSADFEEHLLESGNLLKAVLSKKEGVSNLEQHVSEITPYTRLSQSELFTGGSVGIPLGSELKKEILSSNRVDFLVSFIKWKGIRIFENELKTLTNNGGKLRVITTTYMGASDAKAIDFLSKLDNTEVKVSYNTGNERLHAKAYLFYRETGFHTAYIGSSNFSRSALTDGLEWNLKVTTQEIGHIIDKFQKTFEAYWQSPEFETFNSTIDLPKLKDALKTSQIGSRNIESISAFFDIKPYTYQQEILDQLDTERAVHNNYKNLIVAATGTGKTIISAFDYNNFKQKHQRANLLFVAHREEILRQALGTFRAILKDNNFGEIWKGNQTPTLYNHVFASVKTLKNRIDDLELDSDFYDFIIVDEVHHISASSYRPILEKFNSTILLGLTATPERMDGADILKDFSDKISAEIRLPEALNRRLLCPFQYFGISDSIDLTNVSWKQGRYVKGELTKIYTESDRRVGDIIRNLEKYCLDMQEVRALGFCVSQVHAKFMATKFKERGLKAESLDGNSSDSDRKLFRQQLANREINYLFVVDIFNEGVDIPNIDTVLFLRPTESLTVFLQQLGRGLRLADGKDCLTVLDFVANGRPEYDFANKFRALVGKSNNSIKDEIENGFPHLPLGCSIVLEKVAKQIILENITKATSIRKADLINRIRNWGEHTDLPLTLTNFIAFHQLKLQYIYKRETWSRLLFEAGKIDTLELVNEQYEKNVKSMVLKKWLSTNSLSYFRFIEKVLNNACEISMDSLSDSEKKMALMLHYDFGANSENHDNLESSIATIGKHSFFLEELKEVISILISKIDFQEKEIELPFVMPLQLHARYTREQILAAFEFSTFDKKFPSQSGAEFNRDLNTEILFVNLIKSEENFSPTTMYNDYAISESKFHWQSHNAFRPDKGRGLGYVNHQIDEKKILLFIREQRKDEFGNTIGFVFIGEANLINHHGSKPMNITWSLNEPIPSYLMNQSKKLVS